MAAPNPTPPEIKEFRQQIGSKLREIRKFRDLTIEQLSEMTGIKLSTLANIEDARWPLNMDILYQLKTALEFDIVFEMH